MKLKLAKCHEVEYLGHITTQQGLKTNPALVAAVGDFPVPKNAQEVRRFLGMTSYYTGDSFHSSPRWPRLSLCSLDKMSSSTGVKIARNLLKLSSRSWLIHRLPRTLSAWVQYCLRCDRKFSYYVPCLYL